MSSIKIDPPHLWNLSKHPWYKQRHTFDRPLIKTANSKTFLTLPGCNESYGQFQVILMVKLCICMSWYAVWFFSGKKYAGSEVFPSAQSYIIKLQVQQTQTDLYRQTNGCYQMHYLHTLQSIPRQVHLQETKKIFMSLTGLSFIPPKQMPNPKSLEAKPRTINLLETSLLIHGMNTTLQNMVTRELYMNTWWGKWSRDCYQFPTYELCHWKLCLCRCHNQRRIGRQSPTNPSLGTTPTKKLYSAASTDLGQGFWPWVGRVAGNDNIFFPAYWCNPAFWSFFWYDNDKDLRSRFPIAQLTLSLTFHSHCHILSLETYCINLGNNKLW